MSIPNNHCRNCDHHHQIVPGSPLPPYSVSGICLMDCGCHLFIPTDNLEYLEYKLKEKENAR